jgi:hypothetical protein
MGVGGVVALVEYETAEMCCLLNGVKVWDVEGKAAKQSDLRVVEGVRWCQTTEGGGAVKMFGELVVV